MFIYSLCFFIAACGTYLSCHHPTFYSILLHLLQTTWPCLGSDGYSPASHRGGPRSLLGQFRWEWWRKFDIWRGSAPINTVYLSQYKSTNVLCSFHSVTPTEVTQQFRSSLNSTLKKFNNKHLNSTVASISYILTKHNLCCSRRHSDMFCMILFISFSNNVVRFMQRLNCVNLHAWRNSAASVSCVSTSNSATITPNFYWTWLCCGYSGKENTEMLLNNKFIIYVINKTQLNFIFV
jgi:hypothetical protein